MNFEPVVFHAFVLSADPEKEEEPCDFQTEKDKEFAAFEDCYKQLAQNRLKGKLNALVMHAFEELHRKIPAALIDAELRIRGEKGKTFRSDAVIYFLFRAALLHFPRLEKPVQERYIFFSSDIEKRMKEGESNRLIVKALCSACKYEDYDELYKKYLEKVEEELLCASLSLEEFTKTFEEKCDKFLENIEEELLCDALSLEIFAHTSEEKCLKLKKIAEMQGIEFFPPRRPAEFNCSKNGLRVLNALSDKIIRHYENMHIRLASLFFFKSQDRCWFSLNEFENYIASLINKLAGFISSKPIKSSYILVEDFYFESYNHALFFFALNDMLSTWNVPKNQVAGHFVNLVKELPAPEDENLEKIKSFEVQKTYIALKAALWRTGLPSPPAKLAEALEELKLALQPPKSMELKKKIGDNQAL